MACDTNPVSKTGFVVRHISKSAPLAKETTMNYLLLIYTSEATEAEMQADPAAMEAIMAAYNDFTRETRERGVFVAGEALHPTATATTIRVRNGKATVTDGPFAETKEQLGGFYLLNCKDLDQALEFAAKIPGAQHGSIEVRPIVDFSQAPA
jgi:hypothetical protein